MALRVASYEVGARSLVVYQMEERGSEWAERKDSMARLHGASFSYQVAVSMWRTPAWRGLRKGGQEGIAGTEERRREGGREGRGQLDHLSFLSR